jgi:hypothetical protein
MNRYRILSPQLADGGKWEVQAATTATESIQYSSVTDEERARALVAFLERTGLKLSPRNVAQDGE